MLKKIFSFFFLLVVLFSSCEKCELPRTVRLQIDWNNTQFAFDQSEYWNTYDAVNLKSQLESAFLSNFPETEQIVLVDTLPDYILRLVKFDGIGETNTETLEDPCQEENTALHNLIFGGPETSSFTLHSCRITAELMLLNSQTNTGKRFFCNAVSSEYTTQPSSQDTVNCNAYIVTGQVDPHAAAQQLAGTIRTQTKCMLHELMK